jgi:hypothetical protein
LEAEARRDDNPNISPLPPNTNDLIFHAMSTTADKREKAREVVDILEEISVLLVRFRTSILVL